MQIPRPRRLLWGVAILFVLAQVVRPARTNPPVDPAMTLDAVASPPGAIASTFDRACRDCHTHETTWPWYSNVAPVSWLVIGHVNEARSHMNLSEWGALDVEERDERLEEICDEVDEGNMPLPSYVLAHGSARLTDADRQAVCAWTRSERARLGPAPGSED